MSVLRTFLIGLGSNLGDRHQHLKSALAALKVLPDLKVCCVSSVYESPAWGATATASYLNACVQVSTLWPAETLLGVCLGIEAALGRQRVVGDQFAPRTIDLDVLFANLYTHSTQSLQVPHPRLHLRAFALKPAIEIWPHPQLLDWYGQPQVQVDAQSVIQTGLTL